MKKIGILTHYQIYNHGAILQMLALSYEFASMGYAPYTLTYEKNFDFVPQSEASFAKEKKRWSSIFYYFKTYGWKGVVFKIRTKTIFKKFLKKHFKFQPLYHSQMDAVCIGSDEVFSLEKGVNIMMYGHSVVCPTIFSYAGSFGQTDIKEIEERGCRALIAAGFSENFSALSVRDRNSYDIVRSLCGRKAAVVLDPVLLYGYQKELQKNRKSIFKHKYLLLYAYDTRFNLPHEIEAVRAFARKEKIKILSVGSYHAWADRNIPVNPLELLTWFQQAEYVVTDTFHGTILALLAHREVAVFIRKTKNANKMYDLLSSLAVQEAEVRAEESLLSRFERKIDWEKLDSVLNQKRTESRNYLNEVLSP